MLDAIPSGERRRAVHNLLAFTYADYQGQVLDYLEPEPLQRFGSEQIWDEIIETLLRVLDGAV